MSRDRVSRGRLDEGRLRHSLRAVPIRVQPGGEERAWAMVRAAHGARDVQPRPLRLLRPVTSAAVLAAVAAAVLSPPGRALVGEVRQVIGIEQASPALFRLPTAGRLLVDSEAGSWLVRPDGSKRLLGSWREASWSPGGRFVVTAGGHELAALEPDGTLRWKLARPDVRLPRWGGSRVDTRVAYLSGRSLRVVAGDGAADRRLAPAVARVAPAWRPRTRQPLAPHVLAYATSGSVVVRQADGGRILWRRRAPDVRRLEWSTDGRRLLAVAPSTVRLFDGAGRLVWRDDPADATTAVFATLRPGTYDVTEVRRHGAQSTVFAARTGKALFTGPGRVAEVAWSPDGRWLLVPWRDADQWLFIHATGRRRIQAVSRITGQFDSTRFPRVSGWCCA